MAETNINKGRQTKILSKVLKIAHRKLEKGEKKEDRSSFLDIEKKIHSSNT